MTSLLLRSVELGVGGPKVCVPLVAATVEALERLLDDLVPAHFDLVELRIDHLDGAATDPGVALTALAVVRGGLDEGTPILATFRTTREGGEQSITEAAYVDLVASVIGSGRVDAVDIEMLTPRADLDRLVAAAKAAGVAVVISNHDFAATPPKDEIVQRLRTQQRLGADVVKIAVTPTSPRDVVTLLDATEEFVTHYAERPAITMSMGGLGVVTRLAGEVFGSCVSFGSVGEASAPGQLPVGELRRILDVLHGSA